MICIYRLIWTQDLASIGPLNPLKESTGPIVSLRKLRAIWFLFFVFIAFSKNFVGLCEQLWQTIPEGRFRKLTAFDKNRAAGFKLLNNAQLGISFTNTLPEALAQSRQYSLNGAGLALGDFDRDGLPDIYLCNKGGRNHLYRNVGKWQFQDVTEAMGLSSTNQSSTGALFADLNGDGWLDLVVTVFGGPNAIFFNKAGLNFTNITDSVALPSRANLTSIAASDVDGDGWLELYLCNFGLESIGGDGVSLATRVINGQTKVQGRFANRAKIVDGRLIEFGDQDLLLGNLGEGRFQLRNWEDYFNYSEGKPMRAPWDFGLALQMRDINGDGFPDIYVCNDFQTPDRLWLNDGKGRFNLAPIRTQRTMAYASMGVDFADINRDGLLDFITVEMMPTLHGRRAQESLPHDTGRRGRDSGNELEQVARNCLYLNRGDGTYAEIAQFAGLTASDWSWTPLFLDVDLDGYEDLLITNGNLKDMNNLDAAESEKGGRKPLISQINQPLLTPNAVFRNRGDLTFADMQTSWGFNATNISQGMAVADFDGDGDLDIVVNCLNSPPLIYRNESSAARLKVSLEGLPPNSHGVGAKIFVRGGGLTQFQEIICGGQYLSSSEMVRTFAGFSATNLLDVEIRWRSGRRSFLNQVPSNVELVVQEARATASGNADPTAPAVADALFQPASAVPDRKDELVEFDDYSTQPLLHRKLSHAGPGLAVADINEDGRPDLFFGASFGGMLSIELNLPEGWKKWTTPPLADFGEFKNESPTIPIQRWSFDDVISGQSESVIAWTNRLGELTLAATISSGQGGTGQVRIARLRRGQLVGSVALILEMNPSTLAAGDLDGDGKMELFVGGGSIKDHWPMPTQSILLREIKHGWEIDHTNTPLLRSSGLVSAAQWIDVNGDHQLDLVTVGDWGAPQLYINQGGTLRRAGAEWGLASFQGWWNGIVSGDFDRDGKIDLLISNWGLNTPWTSATNPPLSWGYGERSGASSFVLIEAAFDRSLGNIVPQRPLGELAAVWPDFRERFPTHAAFAKASLDQAWGQSSPQMQRAEVNEWRTTLFLNRGGRFEAHPLPISAHLAPVFGVGAADFNGDGYLDVFLAQNFFALRPEVSRCDAGQGLILLGNGKGDFRALTPRESGVTMDGEQRAVVVADLNGDGNPDLAVTQYGQPPKLWQSRKH